jgi:ankyrin repeat protein
MAAQQGHLEVVRPLLEKGAAVNAKDNDGFTPLARAAQNRDGLLARHLEVMKFLLAKGANPNTLGFAPFGDGKTALQVAEEQGNTEVAELPREAGAKKNRLFTPPRVP